MFTVRFFANGVEKIGGPWLPSIIVTVSNCVLGGARRVVPYDSRLDVTETTKIPACLLFVALTLSTAIPSA